MGDNSQIPIRLNMNNNNQNSTNKESNTTVKDVHVRVDDWMIDITDTYQFKASGIGDSWLIGTDLDNIAGNAYKDGASACPEDLVVPRTLTSQSHVTKPVEVIGQAAYYGCSWKKYDGKTKRFTLTKQVKYIRRIAICGLHDLEEFIVEPGSVLQTIEEHGLAWIGYDTGRYRPQFKTNLTLPSTLYYVEPRGYMFNHIFNLVVYCGSYPLEYYAGLSQEHAAPPELRVSAQYPPNTTLFSYTPVRNPDYEIEELCSIWERGAYFTFDFVDDGVEVTGWGNKTLHWSPPWLKIPPTISRAQVVSIKEKAFLDRETRGPIIIPSSVKRIGAYAFANTQGATSIVSESKDLEIGEGAFQGCGKEAEHPINLTLYRNTRLGKNVFTGAKIGEVYIL